MEPVNKLPNTKHELAQLIDSANLAVDASEAHVRLTCLEAWQLDIPIVLVNAVNVKAAREYCAGSEIKIAAALSYPIGAYPQEVKGLEIEDAVSNGADEIYMLMAHGIFLDGFYDRIEEEMKVLVRLANGRPTKYMIESAALNDEQILRVCHMAVEAGIQYIVTGTDFPQGGFSGTTLNHVTNMVECSEGELGIVACGDISTTAQAVEFLEVGADRICTAAAREIVEGFV